ncbi:MAG TPA: outer membrane beta-barrel protein [Devosia sp.]|nr:outer membrane beta-barrel protein [Devosia sp.]
MQLRFAKPTILALLVGTCLTEPTLAQDSAIADWSGFYAGIYGGYGIDKLPATSNSTTLPYSDGGNDEQLFAALEQSFGGVDSFLGGVRGGWNYQHGALILGVESALTLGSFTRDTSMELHFTDDEVPPSTLDQTFSSAFKTNAIATFEARIGVAFDSWLLYGKGGVAVAHGTSEASSLFSFVDADDPEDSIELPASASTSGLLFGGTIGVGAELLVTDTLSVGAEYNFLSLPAQELTLSGVAIGEAEASQGPIGIHTLKAGINYHF